MTKPQLHHGGSASSLGQSAPAGHRKLAVGYQKQIKEKLGLYFRSRPADFPSDKNIYLPGSTNNSRNKMFAEAAARDRAARMAKATSQTPNNPAD